MYGDDGYFEVISVSVNGSETPGFYLELEGYECVQLHIYISLPGNCEPTRISAALLLGRPVYIQFVQHSLYYMYRTWIIMNYLIVFNPYCENNLF